ncbi:MAG: zinc ribbon domain-containing protein [Steroidobacteraceae bacterium]
MKKPWLAFLLSALCAGAGLVYLGRLGWAVLNFFAVVLVGIALAMALPSDFLQPLGIGLCVASGSLAMGVAQSMNAKLRVQGAVPAAGLTGIPPGPAALPAPGATRASFCGACGARVDGAKFCPDCGQRQRPRDECARCGAKLHAGGRFCVECGAPAV